MAREVFAFSLAFDNAFIIRYNLQKILGTDIGLTMYTDSKQLFDVITRAVHTTEKRLMVGMQAVCEAYNMHETSNVGLVARSSIQRMSDKTRNMQAPKRVKLQRG